MKRMEVLDELLRYMDEAQLLEELVRTLSDDEALESFEYIARMYEINLEDNE